MTEKDFKEYKFLLREKECAELCLKTIERKMMKDKFEGRKLAIARSRVNTLRKEASKKALEISRFIEKCSDPYIRQILYFRYIKCCPWSKVAFLSGGVSSPDGVRKMAVRYIEKQNKTK